VAVEDRTAIAGLPGEYSRVALGTWSMGGWMWGGKPDAAVADATVRRALEVGIDVIDTAPAYGFGFSEEVVGRVLEESGARDRVLVATKAGLRWDAGGEVVKDASRARVLAECEDSLGRLRTDRIDVYQIHWPDPAVAVEETAEACAELLERGLVRAVGVCNFTTAQAGAFAKVCPLASMQSPYNLFQREVEADVLPYCVERGISFLAYSPLARGLLAGMMTEADEPTDEARRRDMFHGEGFRRHLAAVARLDAFARERYGRRVVDIAVRWLLDGGVACALWGARTPEQLDAVAGVRGFTLDAVAREEIAAATRA